MNKFTSVLIALAMLLAACSGGATEETTTTTEPVTTTTESTTTTSTTTTVPPTTTTTVPPTTTTTKPATTTTTAPKENPCRVLLDTEKELEGKAPERTECLNWFGSNLNKRYDSEVRMLAYKLYYEGEVEKSELAPEINEGVPAVVYFLSVNTSNEEAKQSLNKAILEIVAMSDLLAEKLGIEEIYIRAFLKKDTYIDVYVTAETLNKLPEDATPQDAMDALTITVVVDGEEQKNSEEIVPEEDSEDNN